MTARARARATVSLVCVLAGGATGLAGQTIDGVLLERGNNRPIDLAFVTLLTEEGDSVEVTLTDQAGRFRLMSPDPGGFLLSAVAMGYRGRTVGTFELGPGGAISIEFRLDSQPIEIGGMVVETRNPLIREPRLVKNGFVARAQNGFGSFITPRDIEQSDATETSELLARTGRVMTQPGLGGERILMRSTRGYCTPNVFLDGVRIGLAGTDINSYVNLQTLEAVEVYRSGSEAPLQYGGTLDADCGVIVIWTWVR